ncbi:hypothetical protein CEUSTIGMA_g11089.t1 [Chlamydomonas eustigma]|uniref:Uncharacterized protein n=1 Tax=Chlamydomonas eustigma TaxID=1157962 RepID=A0A250XKR0_9CHLO|nr:hypothetical protein CEUSTIGMA_g11089.t1 [Chlamydomonas eustigma]|eukprot:GAX83664.1 hypothetical protein CEUSTIGMA_g11089.t1 [Chlamydomonas eustigma]
MLSNMDSMVDEGIEASLEASFEDFDPPLISDMHITVCICIGSLYALFSALRYVFTSLRIYLSSRRVRSASPSTPPPLQSLSAWEFTPQPPNLPASTSDVFSPFSSSRLVKGTESYHTQQLAVSIGKSAEAIPLLTEISQRGSSPFDHTQAVSASAWTISKKDVIRRRIGLQNETMGELPQEEARVHMTHDTLSGLNTVTPEGTGSRSRGLLWRFNAASWRRGAGGASVERCTVGRHQEICQPLPQQQQQEQGWSSELLAATRRNLFHMSSVEGLETTQAYRDWRNQGAGTQEDQVKCKLSAYQALRRADPDAFRLLLSRPVLTDGNLQPSSRQFLLFEYISNTFITTTTLILAVAPCLPFQSLGAEHSSMYHVLEVLAVVQGLPQEVQLTPLVVWVLLQALSMLQGYTSAIGMTYGVYSMYEDSSYPDHMHVGSLPQVFLSSAIEMVFLGCTLYTGLLYSLFCLLVSADSKKRLCFGQRMMGMQSIAEQTHSVKAVGQFLPASPDAIKRASGRIRSLIGSAGRASRPLDGTDPELTPYAAADAVAPTEAGGSGNASVYSWGAMYCKRPGVGSDALPSADGEMHNAALTGRLGRSYGPSNVAHTPGSLW